MENLDFWRYKKVQVTNKSKILELTTGNSIIFMDEFNNKTVNYINFMKLAKKSRKFIIFYIEKFDKLC